MYKDIKGKWIADLGNGRYKNPILFSDYSDPDVIRVGNDYFMVASSFTYFPALSILHSTDLVNWKLISHAVEKLPFDSYDVPQHGKGAWAPSIRYHDNMFYVCFATPDEGIFMATTKNPFGKWDDVVLMQKASGWIDPCPFWDEDGNAYLVRGVAKSRIGYKSKLFMHKMASDGKSLLDDGALVFDGRINHPTIEGPKMYKRNGYYYIFAPAGSVQTGWQMVARSKNIYGPYEHKIVLQQGNTLINGPHQGGLVDTPNGESWFIHFQDMQGYGRVTHLQPAFWTEDDWINIGIDQNNDFIGEPVLEYSKPKGLYSEIIAPIDSDDFSSDMLGLQWQWQGHYNSDFCSISNDGLRLFALKYKGDNIASASNLLCQLINRPNFKVTTRVDMHLLKEDSCGLVITGGSYYGIRIQDKIAKQVSFELDADNTNSEVVWDEIAINSEQIYLQLRYEYPNIITTFISYDDKNYIKLGESLLYTVSRKSWVGGKIGIFTVSDVNNSEGYCDFKSIIVE